MRRPVGAVSVAALLALLVGAVATWAVPWTPPLPWFGEGGRATQTAVARAATSVARTATAAAWPTLRPTRTATPTRTRTVTPPASAGAGSITPTGTVTPTRTLTPTGVPPAPATPTLEPVAVGTTPPPAPSGVGQTPVPVSSYAPRPLFTPPALDPLTGAVWPLDQEETAFLRLLTDYRVERGRAPVVPHLELAAAAQWMADDTAAIGYLSHHDRQGRDAGWRMVDFGASPYAWMCEVALGGSETGESAFTVFRLSSSHEPCLSDAKYVDVGLGRAWGPVDGWRWYVTFSSGADLYQATPTPGFRA